MPAGLTRLSQLDEETKATVVDICATDPAVIRKLMALGVLPGASITPLQLRPAVLCRVGYTQIAMDLEIARAIVVLPQGEGPSDREEVG